MLRDDGDPLRLSIDIRVQHILRDELQTQIDAFDGIGAAGIVMDVNTSEIVAMVSLPDFDPNRRDRISEDAIFNRATLGVYEMGSTFKIFNTAMALDYGTTTMQDGYDASKPIRIARFTINDDHAKGRWLSVPEIFMYSSNIGSVRMAMDVGGERQRAFMERLGLLAASAVELPERGRPLSPSPWRPINTMTISFGHGIAISPVQLANGVSAIVNGGVRHPATLLRRDSAEMLMGERVVSEKTSRSCAVCCVLLSKTAPDGMQTPRGILWAVKPERQRSPAGTAHIAARLCSLLSLPHSRSMIRAMSCWPWWMSRKATRVPTDMQPAAGWQRQRSSASSSARLRYSVWHRWTKKRLKFAVL